MGIKHIEDYYSEPRQEIMGDVPAWITRWGITILFGIFATIILGCCFISYPQTISASITVIVSEEGVVLGQMLVPSPGFGNVQVGQKVGVRLDCYPYMEYGTLEGEVSNTEDSPLEIAAGQFSYLVEVKFPQGMISNYGITIRPLNAMSGSALIVIRNRYLIELFVSPIKQLLYRK